jgi:YD repeat-containing protein
MKSKKKTSCNYYQNNVDLLSREVNYMSTIIRRSALISELQSQNRALETLRSQLQPLRTAINSYVADSELLGRGFFAHKNYLSQGHIPAIQEMLSGINALIEANSRHINALSTHLQFELYNSEQIERELLSLNNMINSWWFRRYEEYGYHQAWTQAQRNRRTTVSQKQIRLRNYLSATNGLYTGLETLWGRVEIGLRRIENMSVCPNTGEFLLPRNEAIHEMILADILAEVTGLCSTEILGVLRALGLAGTPLYIAFGGDPINMSTGNFIYSKEDISISGRYPLVLKRFYNSIGGTDSIVGTKWTHNYNIRLYDNESSVQVIFGDGHMESFSLNEENGSYTSDCDNKLTKTKRWWELTTPTNEIYKFDQNEGLLKSITDLNSKDNSSGLFKVESTATEFSYNEGLLARVKNPCGSLSFRYDRNNHLIRVTDHTGRKAEYEYTGNLLSKVRHPSGAEYNYEYDKDSNLTKVINPLGIATIENEFDKHGRLINQNFPDGGMYSIDYDDKTNVATEQNGNVIKYERDDKYRTVRIEYLDSEERFEYNEQNKRTKHTDRNGNVRRFKYDESGNITKAIDPLGYATILEYNEHNNPTKITAPNGGVIKNEYDENGNLLSVINPLGYAVKLKNDKQGQVTEVLLPDGSTSSLTYDNKGNITVLTDQDGNETNYEYDELNRVIKATDPMGNSTHFEYNIKGDI